MLPSDPLQPQQDSWLSLVDKLNVKAFVSLTLAPSVQHGVRQLLFTSGLGEWHPGWAQVLRGLEAPGWAMPKPSWGLEASGVSNAEAKLELGGVCGSSVEGLEDTWMGNAKGIGST